MIKTEVEAKQMNEILRKLLPEKNMTSYRITRELFEKEGKSYVTTLLHKMEIYTPPVIKIKRDALVVASKTDYTEPFLKDGGFVALQQKEQKEERDKNKMNWGQRNWQWVALFSIFFGWIFDVAKDPVSIRLNRWLNPNQSEQATPAYTDTSENHETLPLPSDTSEAILKNADTTKK